MVSDKEPAGSAIMTIKALIVDDESLSRDELNYLLKQWKDVDIIGEAKDGEEAIKKVHDYKPDVVFLDIHMPNMDGLTVAKKLADQGVAPLIVFATAYDQHAIKAFEINAIDYLLKPFDEERLKVTIDRIHQKLDNKNAERDKITRFLYQIMAEEDLKRQNKSVSKLAVQSEDRVILLDPTDVIYGYREGREVLIHTNQANYTTKYTLQVLEEKLEKYHFFRTHRSYLVNLNYAKELIPWFNGTYNLLMKDEKQSKVPVSRQYIKPLKDLLEL